jgi:hypothetical protein
MKVGLVGITRRRRHGPSILALTTTAFVFPAPLRARQTPAVPRHTPMPRNGSFAASGVTAAEPQANVHHVREEMACGEIV